MNIFLTLIFSFISAAALILIYSMRVSRKPEKVSAIFLWEGLRNRSIDQPLFKRFFKDRLFYLHTAILTLLLASLILSGLPKTFNAGQRLILIIDVSASMKTMENGESRLDLAKKKAFSLLEDYEGAEIMIISAGKPVERILPFESGKGNIRKAIENIKAEDTAADIEGALLMIKPYIRESDYIYLISDGAGEGLSSYMNEAPNLFFIPVGESKENAGIQALEIYPQDNYEYMSVGVSLKNFGKSDVISTVDILSDSKVIDARHIELPAGGEAAMVFDHVPAITGSITARLNNKDALSADNYRYAVLPAPAYPSVLLVTRENFFLSKLLSGLEGFHATVMSPEELEKGIQTAGGKDHDIGIYDNYTPTAEVSRASIYINPAHNIDGVTFGDGHFVPEEIYSLKEHPIMLYTDFSDVTIRKARKVISFDGLALLGSSGSPLIIISNRQDKERAILGFDIKDSNFPKNVSFPVFFTNLLNRLQPDNNAAIYQINCGDAFSIRLPDRAISGKATVNYPDGRKKNIDIKDGIIIFNDTSIAGIYSVLHEGRETKFAVNIPPAESDINPAEHAPAQERSPEIHKRPFLSYSGIWKIFGILAILLLLSEKRIRERLI